MNWNELRKVLPGKDILEGEPSEFSVLSTNSRFIFNAKDCLFFAIKGVNHNGHNYLKDLYDKGCRSFIVEESIAVADLDGSNIRLVDSSVESLQFLAIDHRNKFQVPIIGITGSNGKTTVKEWLSTILSSKYVVTKNPKSYNSQIGVPLSVWGLSKRSECGIFEAGISRPGEMEKLEKVIQPTIGIFTSIGDAHAEGFSSRREKLLEKSKLFVNCEKIVCSMDDEIVFQTLSKIYPGKLVTWSLDNASAEYHFEWNENGLRLHGEDQIFDLPFKLDAWVSNALHVITSALELGCDPFKINEALKFLKPVEMRLQVKEGKNGTYIIDDTYNNDLPALEIALDFLRLQNQRSRKTVILSDFVQAHKEADLYERLVQMLENHHIDRLIGVGEKIMAASTFKGESEFFPTTKKLLRRLPEFRDEMILIKGARQFQLEKVVQRLQFKSHRTMLKINFEALRHNMEAFRRIVRSDVKVMAMVKAFAYGGGSHEIANFLQFLGVDYLGVAYTDEGISLRENGITIPIMVMNPDLDNLSYIQEYGFEVEVFNNHGLEAVASLQLPISIHIKMETGMNRLGFGKKDIPRILAILKHNPHINVRGIFTHLASAENPKDDDFTRKQIELFESQYQRISDQLNDPPLKHAVNSAGANRWPEYQFDMIRLGIGLYGFDTTNSLNLRPVGTLSSRISQVKEIGKGESVGYGRKGVAKQSSRIATIEIGYADGYLRAFGNGNGKINVNGQLCPTIGNICMDMTMIDVTGVNCQEGDPVIIFGENPTIADLANWSDTIPYEILTNISQRVQRVYTSE